MNLEGVRFGYVPYDMSLQRPGDKRRFVHWARDRGVTFEIVRPGGQYDVVVLSAAADLSTWPATPASGPRLVYDLIDSYLAVPRWSTANLLRGPAKFASRQTRRIVWDYRSAIEAMCRRADAVACSTPEQREQLFRLNGNVHPILDIHEGVVSRTKERYEIGDTVHLVWEGLPYTLDDFEIVSPVLREIQRERPLVLHLVTDLRFAQYARRIRQRETLDLAKKIFPNVQLYSWNEHLLAEIVTACDIAVVPLDLDDPLAAAKPENKLLLLWRMAMPTITSATPAYRRVMAAAGLDLTCATADEWGTSLRRLIADEDARSSAARLGHAYVSEHHDVDASLARWDALFDSVMA